MPTDERMRVVLVLAPERPAGYPNRGPVSIEWLDGDWLCKYCDRVRSSAEPIWIWTPYGRGCTTCALRIGALAIDWSEHVPATRQGRAHARPVQEDETHG